METNWTALSDKIQVTKT